MSKESSMETVTLEPVAMSDKKSWIDIAMIQSGILICVPSLMLGGILAESMNIGSAILSGVAGYIVTIILMIAIGIMGSDLGVPTCVVASGCFGKKGSSSLISGLFMISMVGWFAVQNRVCGTAVTSLIENISGIHLANEVSILVCGIVMLLTAIYGINALNKLNKIAIPALILVTAIGCVLAIKQYGTSNLTMKIENPTMSFVDGIILTISFMATGALNAPDFTRYQKNRKDTILSSSIGVLPAGMAMLILGALMTRIAQQYDITLVFSAIGLPVLGMIVLILATWTTNTTNAYSAGLDAVMIFKLREKDRATATIILGIIATVLSTTSITSYFEGFLNLLGSAFMPIIAIFIMEYWFFAKGKAENYKFHDGWKLSGLIAWLLGFAATMLPFGISFLNGIILSGILYGFLHFVGEQKGRKAESGMI